MSGADSVMKALQYGFAGATFDLIVNRLVASREGEAFRIRKWGGFGFQMVFHCERDRLTWLRAVRKYGAKKHGARPVKKGRGQRRNRRNRR